MDWQTLNAPLSEALGQSVQITSASPVSGGDIHQAAHLHTPVGDFFVKLNHADQLPLFETEAESLNRLQATGSIQTPKVIAVGCQNNQAWLILNWLPMRAQGDDYQRGKDLALLHHQVNPSGDFGWHQDNYIGHTLQPNGWDTDWVRFYGQNRLRHQINLALEAGGTQQLDQLGQRLIDRLDGFFTHYQPEPSPLHGDLWAGNSAFDQDGDPVFFDPASYYGDREADIAMTELFGGYSADFYRGYNEVFPLDAGYQQRKPLYNLYHVLNHFNLFGGHYQRQALSMMQALLDQS